MFAFFIFLFVVVVIYFFTATPEQKDAFLDIPNQKIPPKVQPPPATEPSASALPGQLPVAPYQQLAETSPLPYQDTTMIKANRQQLVSLLELLKGFLAFEAQEISERSDPSIQLPLQTARSDFQMLQAEVEVLNRNPGIQSTLTLSHLNEITSNLAYLQREVRLTGTAGSLQGPIDEFAASLKEGFTNGTASAAPVATKKDISDFLVRLQAEIIRLSASGTTDPIVRARVTALTQLKADLQEVLTKLDSGAMTPAEVPVKKSDLEKALPVLGRPSEPLPQLLKGAGLPSGLGNLLPSSVQKDPATLRKISELVDKYADTIVNGVSATFQVKYTSPREAEAARKSNSSIDKTGFPSAADLDNVSNLKFVPAAIEGGRPVTDRMAALPSDAGRGPSRFDWKERAKAIEDQVKKRGLKPSDFGIMPSNTNVSPEFSWKGYAKMICTRLQATMDPALPETCGCPPMDWKGWRMNHSTK
jgi:hypothetical protein